MVTKAVYIEIVSDLTSQAFLAAFKRFAGRRNLCKVICCDNGTTLQGEDKELRRLFNATSAMAQEVIAQIAANSVTWTYVPPRGRHFGGLWESNIKSFKNHLKRVIGEAKLTYEEFSTVAVQIEACLKSRPLSPISNDVEDLTALTPGHFLTGRALTAPPEPFIEINHKRTVCSRWHLLTMMRNHFWERWRKEYFNQLQQRSKWLEPNHLFQVGDLVIIRDELQAPTKWPLAKIIKLHPEIMVSHESFPSNADLEVQAPDRQNHLATNQRDSNSAPRLPHRRNHRPRSAITEVTARLTPESHYWRCQDSKFVILYFSLALRYLRTALYL